MVRVKQLDENIFSGEITMDLRVLERGRIQVQGVLIMEIMQVLG
jgi:hypothetical protein